MGKLYAILLVMAAMVFLTCCEEVNFRQTQPENAQSLDHFPKHMQGHYVSTDHDTLFVQETILSLYNRGNPCDKLSEQDSLSDLVILKKSNDYYFLNINEHGLWSVILIDNNSSDSIIVSMISSGDEGILKAVNKVTSLEEQKDEDGEIINYIIDPSEAELFQLIDQGLFQPISTLHKTNNN